MPIYLRKLLSRFVRFDIDAYFWFRRDITNLVETAKIPIDLQQDGWHIREVDLECKADIQMLTQLWLIAFPSYRHESRVHKELERANKNGERCWVTANKIEFGAMTWTGFSDNFMFSTIGACIKKSCEMVDISEAYVGYRSYVLPKLRGYKLTATMSQSKVIAAQKAGCKTKHAFVGVKNFASVHNSLIQDDEYKLYYHVTIEILSHKWHIFPNLSKESWTPCGKNKIK